MRPEASPRRPRPLAPGDRIALTAPSSGVAEAHWPRLARAIAHLRQRGFEVVEGATLRRESKECSAPAAERARELQAFLLDDSIAAVMPPWGGERAIELLPLLDFDRLAEARPKWFSGFSDLSTLQLPLCLRAGWMSLHGPNLMELGADALDARTAAVWDMLTQALPPEQHGSQQWQRENADWSANPGAGLVLTEATRWRRLDGDAEPVKLRGRLIGGCLDTVARLAGSPFGDVRSWAQGAGIGPTVVFLENAEMRPCELLRALWSLRLHGWFEQAAGVVLGRHAAPDATDADALQFDDAVHAALGDLGLPVLLDADIGHRPPQLSLIQGEWAEFDWTPTAVTLQQGIGERRDLMLAQAALDGLADVGAGRVLDDTALDAALAMPAR